MKSGKKTCIKSAIEKYGREQFVSVILLAGIEQQEELNLTEIVVIKHLDCREQRLQYSSWRERGPYVE